MALLIDLAPEGRLVARLDGHSVLLPPGLEVDAIKRILLAQREHAGQKFATDSAPTQAQVDSWIREHGVTTDRTQRIRNHFARLTPDEQAMLLEMLGDGE